MSFTSGYSALDLADETFKDYEPEEKEKELPPPDYSRKIPIGEDRRTKRTVEMRLSKSDRIIIFGKTGDGKTTLAKRLLGCFYKGGANVVYPNDVKNDFRTIDKYGGVPKSLVNKHTAGLHRGEKGFEADKYMVTPKYLANDYSDLNPLPRDIKKFIFDLHDLSTSEIMTILEPGTDTKRDVIQEAMSKLRAEYDESELTITKLKGKINEMKEGFDQGRKNAAKSVNTKIDNVIRQEILLSNKNYKRDLMDKVNDQFLVVSMKYYDNYTDDDSIERLDIYLSSLLRQVYQARQQGTIEGRTIIFIDEAHTFIPRGEDRISTNQVVKLVDLGRAYDIPMLFSTQRPSQIPKEDVIDQCSYFFVSPNVPYEGLKELLKTANIWRPSDTSQDKWRSILRNMQTYQFMMIDVERSQYQIIDPYAPLVHHPDDDD